MNELIGPIIAIGIVGVFGVIVVYSVALQKRAVAKQAKGMAAVDESLST
jgi:hypothetical protein